MTNHLCPRCRRPLASRISTALGSVSVCSHCFGFLEYAADGFRSLVPGDLERLPEESRWELLRTRAELRNTKN
jgi:hypothetical protein